MNPDGSSVNPSGYWLEVGMPWDELEDITTKMLGSFKEDLNSIDFRMNRKRKKPDSRSMTKGGLASGYSLGMTDLRIARRGSLLRT
ncbi:hypothetical protein BHE74_00003944 [Ensete ventricosum]|nr:hypothetical protein GW17_00024707 [Ensete ventricosum]RWW87248.1 hypothetical protein BHE74_00003944 [Ensete ventricosum]RZR87602.1 hypothetical protein BHM03_00015053 [Ensete ventricosum]